MRLDLDDGDDITVDMGPLIDCVFLLLIFFLVSTTMKKPEQEIPVELPDPAISAVASPAQQVQNLVVDVEGNFYWGATPIGQQEVHKQLRQWAETDPGAHLRIRVDRNTPARYLVQLVDLCTYEGLTNYAIHTRDGDVQ
ncbi:biopolymer transporter ExbD [Coraliomargarita sp. SDUM461003]|uniref:Biopolymer transporter ExbD n=1 Tax=Thalassobacterium maritimum TaxID=3041265 RepID=A0ABU1AYL5_9BACT|nr:biopolymer transporter ExbD [Coraliomargarita sp. SDUM461003]MDQ8209251.1 biopolymer transporter ExbD [Coraliomargarita sp. SDUM461003]